MCPPMRAHWRHLANTMELVLPSAHPGPQPKRQIDRFSRFYTAHGTNSLYFTMGAPFSKSCPFPRGSGPPSYGARSTKTSYWSLGQMASSLSHPNDAVWQKSKTNSSSIDYCFIWPSFEEITTLILRKADAGLRKYTPGRTLRCGRCLVNILTPFNRRRHRRR